MSLKLSGSLTTLEIATIAERDEPFSVVTFRVGDWCLHETSSGFSVSHASGLSAASGLDWPAAMLLLHDLQVLPTAPASIAELRQQRKARAYAPDVLAWVKAVSGRVRTLHLIGKGNIGKEVANA